MNPFLRFLLSLLFLGLIAPLPAQDIREGVVAFRKKENANALSLVLQGQVKNVEAVLARTFKTATGKRGKGGGLTSGGLVSFENARIARLSNRHLHVYYRVERAARGAKNQARVHLFLAAGEGNFLDSRRYPQEMEAARELLQNLPREVETYELGLVIKEQQKVLDQAINTQEKLVRDSVQLQRRLAETLESIEENKIDRLNQRQEITAAREKLMEFQSQLMRVKRDGSRATSQEATEQINGSGMDIRDENQGPRKRGAPSGGGGN